MTRRYNQKRAVLIFSILFLIGGFICLYTGSRDFYKDKEFLYRENVISDIVSVWTEYNGEKYNATGKSGKKEYCTEEIIRINGKTLTINERYDELPGKYAEHTLISYDGENYEVRDDLMRNTARNNIAGTAFIIIGIILLIYGPSLKL